MRKWLIPPFNWRIWSVLKPAKNEWHLTLNYGNLETVVSPNKPQFPAPSILEMTDSIHSAAVKYPALTDLAKSFLFCVYFSSLSAHLAFASEGAWEPLPGHPQRTSAPLPLHMVSAGRVWPASILCREHEWRDINDISSEDIRTWKMLKYIWAHLSYYL